MSSPKSSSHTGRVAVWGQVVFSSRLAPYVVFLVSLMVTVWIWQVVLKAEEEVAQLNLQKQAAVIGHRIADRLSECESVLLGGSGLFAASREVTRASWRNFIEALRPEVKLAGVQGVGFTLRIAAADLPAHLLKVRAEGFPQYAVHPESPRLEYNAIIYLEPFRDRNLRAFGYDMATESVRRQAMERARDEGITVMTGRVTLVQEIPGQPIQSGFLIYVPIYTPGLPRSSVAERRTSLRGFVYSPFRAGDFIDSLFFSESVDLSLDIYSGSTSHPASLLYSSINNPKSKQILPDFQPRFVETVPVMLLGQPWTLVFKSLPAFETNQRRATASLILALGLMFGLLASGLLFAGSSRNRNLSRLAQMGAKLQEAHTELEQRVQDRTADLARISSHYQMLHAVASDGIHVLDERGLLCEFSESFRLMLGYTTEEMAGLNITQWEAQIPQAELVPRIQALLLKPAVFETVHRRKDGTVFPVEISARGFEINGRNFLYAAARDIAERKQAEAALQDTQARLALAMQQANLAEWEMDAATTTFTLNDRFYALCGTTAAREGGYLMPAEVYAREFLLPEEQGLVGTDLAKLLSGGIDDLQQEHRIRRRDSELRHIFVRIRVVRDAAGRIVGTRGVNQDITERKMAEFKLQELLAQTKRDAHIKGELLREVNHRVTNNLTAVLGLLVHEKEHVAGSERSLVAPVLDRLQQQIRGLLQVHRMLAQSAWAPVALGKLAEQIIRAALSAAPWRQQAVVTLKPSALKVSPRQAGGLALVFNELTTNTVKYASQTSQTVAIGLETENHEEWTTICYRDNGPGYPAEVLAGRQANVGLKLINEIVTKTLRGSLVLSNDQGAVATIRIQLEDENRT